MSPSDLRTLMATAEHHPGETTEQFIARARADHQLSNWRGWLPGLLDSLAPKSLEGVDLESAAWRWLWGTYDEAGNDPVDRAYAADEMVDAFHAGHGIRALPSPWQERLRIMSKQMLAAEMDEDQRGDADWQGGYEWLVTEIREILASLSPIAPASQADGGAPAAVRPTSAGAHSSGERP